MIDFKICERRFTEYYQTFAKPDGSHMTADKLKYFHTQEVCTIARWIMNKDGKFSEAERAEGMLAALFHDVSRFEQYKQYRTFRDDMSFDHGDYSDKLLREGSFLDGLAEAEKERICAGVKVHNKLRIPDDLRSDALKTAKLTRDADKLAIIHLILRFFHDPKVYLSDPAVKLDLPDTAAFDRELAERVMNGEMVSRKELHNVNDFKLTIFAWVNDLNFGASAEYALDQGLYRELSGYVPDEKSAKKLAEFAENRLRTIAGTGAGHVSV